MQSHAFTRKRGRPRSPDTERRIIRAAQASFADRGFDGIAMDDLARTAGASKATVYLYYGSKQELFQAAVEDLLATLPPPSELTSRITGDGVEERLLVVARRLNRLYSGASFELIRRALASDIPPSLRERIWEMAGKPYFDAIDEAMGAIAGLGDRSATIHFIALIAGPETLRSRWSGSAAAPADEASLRDAVRVFVRGHAVPPTQGTRR